MRNVSGRCSEMSSMGGRFCTGSTWARYFMLDQQDVGPSHIEDGGALPELFPGLEGCTRKDL